MGLKAKPTVRGKKGKTEAPIAKAVGDVSVNDFAALLIPGGHSPSRLRKDKAAVGFAGDFLESGKPVFAICHGPQLLVTAGVLEGRTMTGYRSIAREIENAGAQYIDAEVVEDGNLVSSRTPKDLPAFIRGLPDAALRSRGFVGWVEGRNPTSPHSRPFPESKIIPPPPHSFGYRRPFA